MTQPAPKPPTHTARKPYAPVNPIGLPPGPRGLPGVGILPELRRDPLGFFVRQREIFGDYVTFPFAKGRSILVSSPSGAKQVLQDHAAQYMKGRGHQLLRDLLGDGLLTAEGQFWLGQRRLAQPSFGREKLARLATGMEETTQTTLLPRLDAAAHSGATVDLSSVMMEAALAIVTRALFGISLSEADYQVVERAMPPVLKRAVTRSRSALSVEPPGRIWFEGIRGERDLKAVVDKLIAERRAAVQVRSVQQSNDYGDDLLGTYMAAGMDDEQLRDEVMTLFLAGHETTASLLTSLLLVSGQPSRVASGRAGRGPRDHWPTRPADPQPDRAECLFIGNPAALAPGLGGAAFLPARRRNRGLPHPGGRRRDGQSVCDAPPPGALGAAGNV